MTWEEYQVEQALASISGDIDQLKDYMYSGFSLEDNRYELDRVLDRLTSIRKEVL